MDGKSYGCSPVTALQLTMGGSPPDQFDPQQTMAWKRFLCGLTTKNPVHLKMKNTMIVFTAISEQARLMRDQPNV
jgi:hypothetical protein